MCVHNVIRQVPYTYTQTRVNTRRVWADTHAGKTARRFGSHDCDGDAATVAMCACGRVYFILIKRNLRRRRRGARDTPCTRPKPRPLAMHFLCSRSLRHSPSARHRVSPSPSVTREPFHPEAIDASRFLRPARPPPGGRPGDALHTHTRAHRRMCIGVYIYIYNITHNAPWCTYRCSEPRGKTSPGRHIGIPHMQSAAAAICIHCVNFFFFKLSLPDARSIRVLSWSGGKIKNGKPNDKCTCI